MIKISYPPDRPLIKKENDRELIFCVIRKRWVLITPEEWVRQNFLRYLIHSLHYPASLIAVEKQLLLADVKKRFDIVVYDKLETKPFMIIECKEMNVPLTENVLQQVLRYNTNLQAVFLVITNGSHCFACKKINEQFVEIDEMPLFTLI